MHGGVGEERVDRERLGGILAVGGGIGDGEGDGREGLRLAARDGGANREGREVEGARRERRLAAVDGDDEGVVDELGDERGAGLALEGRLDAVEDDGAVVGRDGGVERRARLLAGEEELDADGLGRGGLGRVLAVGDLGRGGIRDEAGQGLRAGERGRGGIRRRPRDAPNPERWTGEGAGGRARAPRAPRTLTETVRVNGGGGSGSATSSSFGSASAGGWSSSAIGRGGR